MFDIYCSEQLDGLAASAIIFRLARLKKADCRIAGFLTFANANDQFNAMASGKGKIIFILDFPPDEVKDIETKLRKITDKNRIAYWNSHHPYDSKTLDLLKKYVTNVEFSGKLKRSAQKEKKLCSADLVCNRFLSKDRIAIELKNLAHDIEFWIRSDERALKLTDLINAGFDKKELVEIISRGVFWSSRFEKIREDYLQKRERALRELTTRLKIVKYLDKKFGFALCESVLSTADAGQKILESNDEVDVSVVIYRNGRISFRRRDACNIDLSEIAALFKGGGHSYASGGMLEVHVSHENFEKVLQIIDRELKNYFLS